MTLIEPDTNLRMPDISTTVETLNLISKMEAQKKIFAQLLHLNISINIKILKMG